MKRLPLIKLYAGGSWGSDISPFFVDSIKGDGVYGYEGGTLPCGDYTPNPRDCIPNFAPTVAEPAIFLVRSNQPVSLSLANKNAETPFLGDCTIIIKEYSKKDLDAALVSCPLNTTAYPDIGWVTYVDDSWKTKSGELLNSITIVLEKIKPLK